MAFDPYWDPAYLDCIFDDAPHAAPPRPRRDRDLRLVNPPRPEDDVPARPVEPTSPHHPDDADAAYHWSKYWSDF